ncbi:MAG TPA: hypothetical protein VGM94_14135 [Galbitalea sp.]
MVALISVGFGAAPAQASTSATRCGLATQINVRGTGVAAGKGTGRVYTSGGTDSTLNVLISDENAQPDLPIYQEQLAFPATRLDLSDPKSKNYVPAFKQASATWSARSMVLRPPALTPTLFWPDIRKALM